MEIRKVDDEVSVAPQISAGDVAEIARAGFRTIICNRPDGEGPDQPAFDRIARAAAQAGVEVRYQPVVSGAVGDEDGRKFGELLDEAPKPVLAYCRSGTRCVTLWSLSRAGRLPVAEILEKARRAGYDMSGIAGRIVAAD